jgi:hypothetical protein
MPILVFKKQALPDASCLYFNITVIIAAYTKHTVTQPWLSPPQPVAGGHRTLFFQRQYSHRLPRFLSFLFFFFFFFCFCGNAAPPFLFGNTPPHDGAPSFVTFWRRFLPLCGHVTEIVRHGGAIAIARHLVCVGVVEHRHKWQKHSYYVSEKNKIHITCKTREQ